ncbi:hypothetical protein [Chloroflexus sp.]
MKRRLTDTAEVDRRKRSDLIQTLQHGSEGLFGQATNGGGCQVLRK